MAITEFKGLNRFLSNFYSSPVEYQGVIYSTVEHAYQAAKTLKKEEREHIAGLGSPVQAKWAGRRVTLRSDWDTVKLDVMTYLVRQKFSQPDLRRALLDTGNEMIIGGNTWNDTFWGVCRGKGHNYLGKILMRVREELRLEIVVVDGEKAK